MAPIPFGMMMNSSQGGFQSTFSPIGCAAIRFHSSVLCITKLMTGRLDRSLRALPAPTHFFAVLLSEGRGILGENDRTSSRQAQRSAMLYQFRSSGTVCYPVEFLRQ